MVVAVPGDDGRAVAVLPEHERVTPRRGAIDADEQAVLVRPGDQVAVVADAHRHRDPLLQQGPLLALLGGSLLDSALPAHPTSASTSAHRFDTAWSLAAPACSRSTAASQRSWSRSLTTASRTSWPSTAGSRASRSPRSRPNSPAYLRQRASVVLVGFG